jgi:esterase/lipase superfamily enzyme
MGNPKPVIALFGSQDDHALKLSKMVWGGKARLGDVNPNEEPYRSEFRRDRVHVFDLTSMKGDSHSRAFEDMKSVMGMIEERLAEGQQMTDSESP